MLPVLTVSYPGKPPFHVVPKTNIESFSHHKYPETVFVGFRMFTFCSHPLSVRLCLPTLCGSFRTTSAVGWLSGVHLFFVMFLFVSPGHDNFKILFCRGGGYATCALGWFPAVVRFFFFLLFVFFFVSCFSTLAERC